MKSLDERIADAERRAAETWRPREDRRHAEHALDALNARKLAYLIARTDPSTGEIRPEPVEVIDLAAGAASITERGA
jgi:hypothetical protein